MNAMDFFWGVLGLISALVVLGGASAAWLTYRHRIPALADERHVAVTRDGWLISLYRYLPRAKGPGSGPVLLCHGLIANRANLDLDEKRSLARYLAAAGFDAWLIELRGSGLSRDSDGSRGLGRITFDDYVDQDIPAAIDTVLKETGYERLQWVGHSMGGMLLYAHLSSRKDPAIASAVTVASPVDFGVMAHKARHMLGLRPLLRLRWVPLGYLLRALLPLIALSRRAALRLGLVPENVSTKERTEILVNVIEGFGPAGVLEQFGNWVEEGVYRSRDGRRAYDSLANLHCPLLVIAADCDYIAPPDSVRPASESASAGERVYRLFGKQAGDDREYGHGDIVISDAARKNVFPVITDWLVKHAPPPPGP